MGQYCWHNICCNSISISKLLQSWCSIVGILYIAIVMQTCLFACNNWICHQTSEIYIQVEDN